MGAPRTFVAGSRGSRLALRQTELVLETLRRVHPGLALHVQTIRTTGDKVTGVALSQLGGQGVFVKELERALLAQEIDIAIHSYKDMPASLSEGLALAAVTAREDVRDVVVSKSGLGLEALPPGSTVGTGSPRRAAQVLALRPDLRIAGIRGNVDTRLRKVAEGEVDAVVLAAAGLARLGRTDRMTEVLPVDAMLPAVGQGALAVEVREDDIEAQRLVAVVDDIETRRATTAERAFLRRLGGGCHLAIAALGTLENDRLTVRGMVADTGGQNLLRGEVQGAPEEAEALGERLAEDLLARGAAGLLEASGTP